jgi:hypothetical protein
MTLLARIAILILAFALAACSLSKIPFSCHAGMDVDGGDSYLGPAYTDANGDYHC